MRRASRRHLHQHHQRRLTLFPVTTAIFAAFTHAQAGPDADARFVRGFIPGLCTFACFCAVLAVALRELSVPIAFGTALAVQLALQAAILSAPAATASDPAGVADRRR